MRRPDITCLCSPLKLPSLLSLFRSAGFFPLTPLLLRSVGTVPPLQARSCRAERQGSNFALAPRASSSCVRWKRNDPLKENAVFQTACTRAARARVKTEASLGWDTQTFPGRLSYTRPKDRRPNYKQHYEENPFANMNSTITYSFSYWPGTCDT